MTRKQACDDKEMARNDNEEECEMIVIIDRKIDDIKNELLYNFINEKTKRNKRLYSC